MVAIANFSSLLEIAFGMNALFYWFEIHETVIARMKASRDIDDEPVKAAFHTREIRSMARAVKWWTFGMSSLALYYMCVAAFNPAAKWSTTEAIALLAILFLPTPVYSSALWWIAERKVGMLKES